jgi:tetratricopeptide (TPR) repeat protein
MPSARRSPLAACLLALICLAGSTRADQTAGIIASDLDLAARQIETGEFGAARDWLSDHVKGLSGGVNRYDPALVRPLTLLGDAYMGLGEPAEALRQYQHATHLARVSSGLRSPEQVEIVYREASALQALGAVQDANEREEYAFRILAEASDPNDPELLPAIDRLAAWYLKTDKPYPARALYQQALVIHQAANELESEAAVPALRGLAATFVLERFPPVYERNEEPPIGAGISPMMAAQMASGGLPAGEQALQQVARIRKAQEDSNPQGYLEAILELADWYNLFEKPSRANPLYAHAFELMAKVPNADPVAFFADPRTLYFPDPGQTRDRAVRGKGEIRDGFVEIGYAVTETGFSRDLVTIASEPKGLMDMRVRRSLRAARYRPALVNGVPVATANRVYRHEFQYEEEPEPPAEGAADEDQGKDKGTDKGTDQKDSSPKDTDKPQ